MKWQVPVSASSGFTSARGEFNRQRGSARQLLHPAIDGFRGRDVSITQVVVERRRVQFAGNPGTGDQCLQLGGKSESGGARMIVKRFDAEPVPRQEKSAAALVPDGEGKHAAKPFDAGVSEFFVGMNDDLGVGPGMEAVAARLQLAAQFGKVVNFTIDNDPDCSV